MREAATVNISGDPGWDERLVELIGGNPPPEVSRFVDRLPGGYREVTTPEEAAEDIGLAAGLGRLPSSVAGPAILGVTHRIVVRPALDEGSTFRLRRLGIEAMELTSALPLLESFGLVIVQSLPLLLEGAAGGVVHVDDISVRVAQAERQPPAFSFDLAADGARLVEAIEATSSGLADADALNRLVVSAGLTWRQVTVLRAYWRYWHQVAGLSRRQLTEPPVRHPTIARAIVDYFEARFDPVRAEAGAPAAGGAERQSAGGSGPRPGASGSQRPGGAERRRALEGLDQVVHFDDDRVLRAALTLVDATLRTNYFSTFSAGGSPPAGGTGAVTPAPLVLKLDSRSVPEMTAPKPLVETFVHGPTVEGIHLRAGLIARGGIRWSERPDDLRTEVLDLAFAQVKKNSVIVPTGAKGGFVCRAAPAAAGTDLSGPAPAEVGPALAEKGPASAEVGPASAEAGAAPAEVRAAYRTFIAALLDVTDNIAGGSVVTPAGVVCYDGPDPYLVVAADKGTATFSDLANEIAGSRRFWLGDAFASGGSHGYDHKAMGITARGAWVSVRRHFWELGVDVAVDPIRTVGVGDMSGDVFGNGMLQSRAIKLVAAFDHRHVFVDPDPDPETSFEERRRLAAMARSSWDDYRRGAISTGGGVWPRDAKAIPLSAPARRALGVDRDELSAPQLVSAILAAPSDLLWFGGIGTFVKATGEADAEVADHANDAVRITADELRARVVAEGANLAVTERARIQYSRRGGRINADFIDNAAGVATSDREVNLKILLALAVERGRLASPERDGLLRRAEGEVATEVLRQVDHSVAALNRAAATSATDLDAYQAVIDDLEERGAFDRSVEVLPDDQEISRRREAGAGLIRPELATILTYVKSDVVAALEASPLSASPALIDSAVGYFPQEMRSQFADLIPEHRLARQLVATDVAGEVVDNMGVVWAHDLAAELSRPLDEVAAAFWVARRLTGADELWAELEQPGTSSAEVTSALHAEVASSVAALTRLYLTPSPAGRPGAAAGPALEGSEVFDPVLAMERDGSLSELPDAAVAPCPAAWEKLGIDPATAERFCRPARIVELVRSAAVSRAAGQSISAAAEALGSIGALAAVVGIDGVAAAFIGTGAAEGALGRPPARLLVWQARAVLDDLDSWRRQVAATVLASGSPGQRAPAPAGAISGWAEAQREALARAADLVSPARIGARPPVERLAAAALALRRLPGP